MGGDSLFTLKQTDTGIYYLHDYIPVRQFRYHSDEEVAISKQIWEYKDGDADALNTFTNELMQAISMVVKNQGGDKIGLVAVPPSKVNKNSTIRTSIWNMENWYKQGVTESAFGCSKRIMDFGNLLTRISDVCTSHEGRRATYDEHMESIACSRDHLSKYWTTFIILDDVTTKGTNMDVCRDILIANGAKEQYIIRMAIARTV